MMPSTRTVIARILDHLPRFAVAVAVAASGHNIPLMVRPSPDFDEGAHGGIAAEIFPVKLTPHSGRLSCSATFPVVNGDPMRALLTSAWLVFLALIGSSVASSADDLTTCRIGKGDIATAACTRALESNRLDSSMRALVIGARAIAYHRNGEHERAIADFSAVIRLDAKDNVALIGRGFAYADLGDLNRALVDHTEAIRIAPKDSRGFSARGQSYMRKGDTDLAIGDFNVALRLNPQDHSTRGLRATAFLQKSDFDSAISDRNVLIRIDPKEAWNYVGRGQAFKGKMDMDRAIADFSEAIRLDPKISQAFGLRGIAFYYKRKHDQAIADLSESVRLDPNNKVASKILADIRKRTAITAIYPPRLPPAFDAAPPGVSGGAIAKPAFASGGRVALVIGNGNYESMQQLPNPPNDAADIAQLLKKLGFKVTLAVDASRAAMEDALAAFAQEARQADTALVFYAGHGLQHQGVNYLAPVDARIADETDLRKFVRVQSVLEDLQNVSGVRILILDACRDNEAIRQLAAVLPKTRSAAFRSGLAGEKAEGVIIAYATQPDRVAADGDGRNSPFTAALLKNLPTPGVELRTMFTRVRAEVLRTTSGAQRPETSDSLDGEVVLSTP